MGSIRLLGTLALIALPGSLIGCDTTARTFEVNALQTASVPGSGPLAASSGSANQAPSPNASSSASSDLTSGMTANATDPSSSALPSGALPSDTGSGATSSTSDADGGDPIPSASSSAAPPAVGELSAACSLDSECSSEHCVGGLCCNSACDGVCSSCSLPGKEGYCSAPENDSACPAPQCGQDSACRSFTLPDGGNCEDVGVCKTSVACDTNYADTTTPCSNGEGLCDGAGTCVVPDKLSLGEACESDDECAEGQCVNAGSSKICCDSACNGTCQACGSDGHCDQAPADDAACGVVTCPADTSCTTYPNDLSSNRCVGFGQCATSGTYCQPNYRNPGYSCGSGLECDGQGGCDSVCSNSEAWCTDHCVDPQTDNAHCGVNANCAGGTACAGNTACEGGSCLVQCGASQVRCSNTCIDPVVDVQHCGASGSCSGNQAGAVCAATGACVQSSCRNWRGQSASWDAVSAGSYPEVFAGSNGDIYAAWEKYDANNNNNIWYARYNASTRQWGAGELVENDTAFANGAEPVVDGANTPIVVWFQNSGAGGNSVIRASNRTSQGSWTAPQNLSSTSQIAMWPLVGALSNGDVLATWHQRPDASGADSVYFARRTNNAWLAAQSLATPVGSAQIQALIPDTKGGAMAVWVTYPLGSTNSVVYAARWNGSSWGAATSFSDNTDTKLYFAGGADSSGNYYIAWSRFTANGNITEFARYDQNGTWTSGSLTSGGSYVSVVVTPTGTPYIAWWGSAGMVWTKRDISTGAWQAPQVLGNDNTGAIKADSKGNIFAVWRENYKLLWRYMPVGASQFSNPQPIMDIQDYIFSFDFVVGSDGRAMASFSQGPGNGTSTQGFDRFD